MPASASSLAVGFLALPDERRLLALDDISMTVVRSRGLSPPRQQGYWRGADVVQIGLFDHGEAQGTQPGARSKKSDDG